MCSMDGPGKIQWARNAIHKPFVFLQNQHSEIIPLDAEPLCYAPLVTFTSMMCSQISQLELGSFVHHKTAKDAISAAISTCAATKDYLSIHEHIGLNALAGHTRLPWVLIR